MTENYLLIAQADQPKLVLLDTNTLEVADEFDVQGRIAVLGCSSDSQHGFAIHRDDDCVSIISLKPDIMIGTISTDKQPTHFHAHAGQSVVFNDGDGVVTIFDEAKLPQFSRHKVTQPDHGSAMLIGDYMLVGYLRMGAIEIYRRGSFRPFQTYDCCPMLHGATQVDNTALFGCSDGVLMLKLHENYFKMTKIDNPPDTPTRVRVGIFSTHHATMHVLGNFGQGIVVINTDEGTMQVISLTESPLKFSFDTTGQSILALTADGNLSRLSLSGDLHYQMNISDAVSPPKGPDKKARPTYTVGTNTIYVIDPEKQILSEINQDDLSIKRQVALDFKPSAIVRIGG